jgi:hypothetical protein
MVGTNVKHLVVLYAWQLHNLYGALKAHRDRVEEFHNARSKDATKFGGSKCWKGARKKEAKYTHACYGAAATYQNREGVRPGAGRRASTAERHWMAASHW